MYNVACAVKKDGANLVTIYRNIEAVNVRAAMQRAQISMAVANGVKRTDVKVKCYCSDGKPIGCDPSLREVCKVIK